MMGYPNKSQWLEQLCQYLFLVYEFFEAKHSPDPTKIKTKINDYSYFEWPNEREQILLLMCSLEKLTLLLHPQCKYHQPLKLANHKGASGGTWPWGSWP